MLQQQATKTGSDTRISTAYLIAAIVMTLSVLKGHSPTASFFECDISYLWRVARSLGIYRAV